MTISWNLIYETIDYGVWIIFAEPFRTIGGSAVLYLIKTLGFFQ